MKTDLISRYSNGLIDKGYNNFSSQELKKPNEVNNSQEVNKSKDINSVNNRNNNYKNIITKKEKQFFIKMFPESEEQIRNHELFNRNGKINNPNIYKGSIVDGKF